MHNETEIVDDQSVVVEHNFDFDCTFYSNSDFDMKIQNVENTVEDEVYLFIGIRKKSTKVLTAIKSMTISVLNLSEQAFTIKYYVLQNKMEDVLCFQPFKVF